jgi:hypothetical protein
MKENCGRERKGVYVIRKNRNMKKVIEKARRAGLLGMDRAGGW